MGILCAEKMISVELGVSKIGVAFEGVPLKRIRAFWGA